MTIIFTLSMPGCASWNGRWSGEGNLYAIVKSFPGKRGEAKARELLAAGYWSHNFGDGWRAGVSATEAKSPADVRKVRKASRGFCGYDWMVANILRYGSTQEPKEATP